MLGLQVTLYIDRAVSIGTRRYFRRHSADESAPTTVANTLIGWAVKTVPWAVMEKFDQLGVDTGTPARHVLIERGRARWPAGTPTIRPAAGAWRHGRAVVETSLLPPEVIALIAS